MAATAKHVVRVYAAALFTAAQRGDIVEQVAAELTLVRSTVQHSEELRTVLLRGVTPDATKKRILKKLFEPHVSALTLDFLNLLVDKRREDVVESIDTAFRKIADERSNIVRAEVVSAVALTEEELQEMRAALGRMTGKQVELEPTVDPSVIGGVVIRVGDTLIDGSVRAQIARLKETMAAA
ncbi:MAG: ATP synthase F1 subunit delta [Armatimonadetes bacterium]|nr:ATP synthase F1 subunit delta [Armatimonadota bacterium]